MSGTIRIPGCPVCSKKFGFKLGVSPKLLPCGHSVCGPCVDPCSSCPCCSVPLGPAPPPLNDVLAKYGERALTIASGGGSTCEGCRAEGFDSGLCTHTCVTCDNKPMCGEHSRIHERRGHRVQESLKGSSDSCSVHTGSPLFFFCFTCNKPVCQSCTVLEHPPATHEVKDSKASAEILAKKLENGVKVFRKGVIDLEAGGGVILDAMDTEKRVKDGALAAVDAALEVIVSAAQRAAAGMRAGILARFDRNTKLLQADVDTMKLKYSQLSIMCDIGTAAVAARDPPEIVKTMETMQTVAKLIAPYPGLPFDATKSVVPVFNLHPLLSDIAALADTAEGVVPPAASVPAAVTKPEAPAVSVPSPSPSPIPLKATTTTTAAPPVTEHLVKPSQYKPPVPASSMKPQAPVQPTMTSPLPAPAAHHTSSHVSALQSALSAQFAATGAAAPFGAVPIIRARSKEVEVGEGKSVSPPPPPTGPAPPEAYAASPGGVSMIHTTQLKSLFKLSPDGQSWESKAPGSVGCVILGKGTSYRVLFYDAAQRHIGLCGILPDATVQLQARPDTVQLTFKSVSSVGSSAPGCDTSPGTWCLIASDPEAASAFVRAFVLTQVHCSWHSFGMEAMGRLPLQWALTAPPNDARTFTEGDTAGVTISLWPIAASPLDSPVSILTSEPVFTNFATKKLVRVLIGSKTSGGLGGALLGTAVGSQHWVFLPSSQALDAVGVHGIADDGSWMACDVKLEKIKGRDDHQAAAGGVPKGSAGISDLLDID